MRFLLPKFVIIINFYACTLAVSNLPRDFVCNKKHIPSESVSRSLNIACDALSHINSRYLFSASFDGSILFGIRDATLFVSSANLCCSPKKGKVKEIPKKLSTFHMSYRVVIDSMCNLIGLVYILNQSYYRCTQVLDLNHGSISSSETGLNIFSTNYAYRCKNTIFLYKDVVRSFEYLREQYFRLDQKERMISRKRTTSTEFQDKALYLWTLYADRETKEFFFDIKYPYVMAMNKNSNLVGMMHKNNRKWVRCVEMQSVRSEAPRFQDSTKNSIGETFFDNVSSYTCGRSDISATILNSHMQAACRVIKEDSGKIRVRQTAYPRLKLAGIDMGSDVRFWPLRPPENLRYQDSEFTTDSMTEETHHFGKYATTSEYYIKLSLSCEFLGVYESSDRKYKECQKKQPTLPPEKKEPKIPDLNF
ncbi:BgTH12-07781 [Blumeria graminis f. sp. triticale]|uniref:BgTH12-07781 n=1 Tax=Blumeria graminis f. sp. triticale TaxID=1689686 RepID=A0A9W4D9L8_BLUGR|nr:BgTH12-07781 [Blumeria graminis f. sp. triticale]